MIPLLHRTRVTGSIVGCTIASDSDKIFMIDNLFHFYELDTEDLSFTKSIQLLKDAKGRHKFTRSLSTSTQGYLFISPSKSSTGVVLRDNKTVIKIASLKWHKASVSSSQFSPNGQYLATGGEDGKTFVFQLPSLKLASSLPPCPDYISAVVFDKGGEKLASASFDGVVTILDLEVGRITDTVEVESVVEDGIFINGGSQFFFACRDGKVGIYNLETKKIIRQELGKEWFTRVQTTPDDQFIILGTKSNLLYIVRLEDFEVLHMLPLEHNGVSALEIGMDKLIVAFIDGYVEFYNLKKSLDTFQGLIDEGNLFDAIKLTKDENIFLSLLPVYTKAIEKQWKITLKEAIDLLATNKFQEAVSLVHPFMDDKRKKAEFSQYAQQVEAVSKFCDAWESKDVVTAYKIAEQTPEVKKLPFYDMLEEYFLQVFNAAKKLLIIDMNANLPKAQALLKPFLNVRSKKDVANSLLKESKRFYQADMLLKERKFAEFFKLAEKFPMLKQTNSYDKAMYMIPQVIDRVNQLISNKKYEKAIELSTFLSTLVPFKDVGAENLRLIENQQNFLTAIDDQDIKRAYDLALQEPRLQAMPEYTELNNTFKDLAKEATNLAGEGQSNKVIDLLNPYFEIEYWKDKIASIIKISYLYELDNAAQNKAAFSDVNWKKSVGVYLDRFGLDEEISKICESHGLMDCLADTDKGDPKGYLSLPYTYTVLIRDAESGFNTVGGGDTSASMADIDALLAEHEE